MENSRRSYKEDKLFIRQFYRTIGRLYCPVLCDYISFTRRGFDHLIGKKDTIRPKSEQKRRFELLLYVPSIIIDPNAKYSEEVKIIDGKNIHYWIFSRIIDDTFITVIIRQTPNGKKHFLTVYGKKQKTTP